MALKAYQPTSPGRRGGSVDDYKDITRSKPEKRLTKGLHKTGGRNNKGRLTVRHRGGGHKRLYRIIDFTRNIESTAIVQSIEYDPNRTCRIALVRYEDGRKRYILAADTLSVGDKVMRSETAPARPGNARPLGKMPLGTIVHGVELSPGKGAKLVRAAGVGAQVMAHEGKYTLLRMPSREMRSVLSECAAAIGALSNPEHKNLKLGKAGRSRHRGRRPSVRGSAMSPNAHPHGGGEGHAPIGLKGPKTPWGKPALGYVTRRNKASNKYILRKRKER